MIKLLSINLNILLRSYYHDVTIVDKFKYFIKTNYNETIVEKFKYFIKMQLL
jgi:hypothetical protein